MQLAVQALPTPAGLAPTRRGTRGAAHSAAIPRRCTRVDAAAAAAACRRRGAVRAAAAAATAADPIEVEELKAALLDSFWGTERGLAASSDSRAEINELITQLEARNPTPEPNEARAALGGAWRLAYTSNSELIALLALGRLPLVEVGEISQTIDPMGQTVENRVELQAPLSKTALSATASFEVRSPKLLQVQFQEGRVATPELLADLALPTSLEVLGQQVDLAPLQPLLQPLEGPLRSALGAAGDLLRGLPDLRVPIPSSTSSAASSWLLTTYLDDTLRITRGDGGSVFVLVKDSGDAAGAGAAYAGQMTGSDWERMEDQDPPASGVGQVAAASTVVAEAVVSEAQEVEGASAAAAAVVEAVVVEPESDVGSTYGNGAAP